MLSSRCLGKLVKTLGSFMFCPRRILRNKLLWRNDFFCIDCHDKFRSSIGQVETWCSLDSLFQSPDESRNRNDVVEALVLRAKFYDHRLDIFSTTAQPCLYRRRLLVKFFTNFRHFETFKVKRRTD